MGFPYYFEAILIKITINIISGILAMNEICYPVKIIKSLIYKKSKHKVMISGKLWNKITENDNSKGNLIGTMKGDTLILNYKFNAEGTTSEMPVKMLA